LDKTTSSAAAPTFPESELPIAIRYRALFNTATRGIVMLDEQGNVSEVNESFCMMLGYTVVEMMHFNIAHWESEPTETGLIQILAGSNNNPILQETKYRKKDGSIIDVAIEGFGILKDGRQNVYASIHDITDRKKAEEALQESETRYRRLFESAKDGILILDAENGHITDVNPYLLSMLGYSKSELIGKEVWEIGFLKDERASKFEFLKLQRKRYARYDDLPLKTSQGKLVNVEFVSNVYLENNKQVIQCNIRDITERKAVSAALRKSEIRYRSLLYNMDAGVILFLPDASIKHANRKAAELLGFSEDQMIGMTTTDAKWKYLAEDKTALLPALHPVNKIIAEKRLIKDFIAGVYRPAKHDTVWLLINGFPVLDEKGEVEEILISFIDITKIKEANAKQELLDQQTKIASLVPGVIFQYRLRPDGSSCFPYASEAIRDIYKVNPEDVLEDATKVLCRIHPDDYATVIASILASAQNLSAWLHEYRVKFEDESIITVYGSANPEMEADGSVLWHGFITDITELRKTQTRIRQLSQAVEQSPVSIVITDTAGTVEYVNKQHVKLTGYSAAETIGKNERILKSGQTSTEEYEYLWKTILSGKKWHGEFQNRKKNGELYWESSAISPMLDENGMTTHFLAIKEDITDRKLVEEKIAELNRDFVNFLENTSDFIYFKDINSRFRFCSQTLADITGNASWTDIIGKNAEDIFPAEIARIHHDEEIQIFATGKPLLNKINAYIDASGNPGWISANKWPLLNDEGKVVGLYGISRDITELRKSQDELKKYSSELKTSNTDLEHFAYIASHDLQEPLRMVSSFLKLLEKKLDGQLNETTRQYMHFATDGANRMKILIDDLLQYSRVGNNKEAFAETDLNEVLRYIVWVLKETVDKVGAVITVRPMPVIKANKILMNELFLNLLNNALKYKGNRQPLIEVGCSETAGYYTFYVKDNGIGINAAYYKRIFVIFQRLHAKDEYSGTGIGLALCKKIVETHHGTIWVESEEGSGSTFYFSIPK